MIRRKFETNFKVLDDLAAWADEINKNATDQARTIFNDIQPAMLGEMKTYPPKPPNSKYVRTFKLRDGMYVVFIETQDGFEIRAGNDVDYAIWVVGSLAQAREAAIRFQQAFHANNGWFPLTDTVTYWLGVFDEEMRTWFEQELSQFGEVQSSQRAFTRIR